MQQQLLFKLPGFPPPTRNSYLSWTPTRHNKQFWVNAEVQNAEVRRAEVATCKMQKLNVVNFHISPIHRWQTQIACVKSMFIWTGAYVNRCQKLDRTEYRLAKTGVTVKKIMHCLNHSCQFQFLYIVLRLASNISSHGLMKQKETTGEPMGTICDRMAVKSFNLI